MHDWTQFLRFKRKIEGYSILQLCACSRYLGMSFELLAATIRQL